MPRLLIHLGHEKTGSTFLQETLRANHDVLARAGVFFPMTGNSVSPRGTPTGNGGRLFKSRGDFRRVLAQAARQAGSEDVVRAGAASDLLFSGEVLFSQILSLGAIDFVRDEAIAAGYDEVAFLIFIRDPIGHATSFWQQFVKGWKGLETPLDDWLAESYGTPRGVERLMDIVEAAPGCTLTILNYSRRRKRIVEDMCDWAGIPFAEMVPLQDATINRSLTAGEVEMQRYLNRILGPSGALFGHRMVYTLPELRGRTLTPSLTAQEAVLSRLGPVIERVNARLPESERYAEDRVGAPPETFEFTPEQLAAMADCLGGEILRLRGRKQARPGEGALARIGRLLPDHARRKVKLALTRFRPG